MSENVYRNIHQNYTELRIFLQQEIESERRKSLLISVGSSDEKKKSIEIRSEHFSPSFYFKFINVSCFFVPLTMFEVRTMFAIERK